MIQSLAGEWSLCCDPEPTRFSAPPDAYPQQMPLPATTAQCGIGAYNSARETGYLTEKYPFCGQIWLRKVVTLPEEMRNAPCFLFLERTRISRLWVNGVYIGTENSLCTPHIYDLTGKVAAKTELVLCIANQGYPTKGGHMTSPDTQTNWIGITGEIALMTRKHITGVQVFPKAAARRVTVHATLHGAQDLPCRVSVRSAEGQILLKDVILHSEENGKACFSLSLPEDTPLWSEFTPNVLEMTLTPQQGEETTVQFGLRDFQAKGKVFTINGTETMLRGKHDALLFPRTGAAPTTLSEWKRIMGIYKEWGFNHVRYHTCCPPDAAFAAADVLGLYLEPELPFWGTISAEEDAECNPTEQEYLIREGLRICAAFGNHPSFCMLSLGNELWGDVKRLNGILHRLKEADPRPLYTQGSNNFQHMPVQMPHEDFWTGVRFGEGKLLRGSFARCDAPQGRIQTEAPSTDWDYSMEWKAGEEQAAEKSETVSLEIQYGTGVKQVRTEKRQAFLPNIPVITHEIGQYAVYPDYREISHYDGVLEARNFSVFEERLQAAGMGKEAERFFRCSGALARDCYQMELEAAMRTPEIAGFQLLDLQDFTGQGTATVGMLNALLENKGLISPKEWRSFCGDFVLLARFSSFVLTAGEPWQIGLAVRSSRPEISAQGLCVRLSIENNMVEEHMFSLPQLSPGYHEIGGLTLHIPKDSMGKATLTLSCTKDSLEKRYALTILPPVGEKPLSLPYVHTIDKAREALRKGQRVVYLARDWKNTIPAEYCTDFWNYPMFRKISEEMGKPLPVGTLGLCVDTDHPIPKMLFSERYTTPLWHSILRHAECAVLDKANCRPIVQMIDNVERCHRLGLLFELETENGRLLASTIRLDEAPNDPAMQRLRQAVLCYLQQR